MTTFVMAKNNPICTSCPYKGHNHYAKCDIRKNLSHVKEDIADAYIKQKPMPALPNCIDEAVSQRHVSKFGQFLNKHPLFAKIYESINGSVYR